MKKICQLVFKMLTHKILDGDRQKQIRRSRALFRTAGPGYLYGASPQSRRHC